MRLLIHVLLLALVAMAATAAPAATTTSVSPCPSSTKASSALLQAARQQLPLQRQAAKSSSVTRVASWEQLVKAVDDHDGGQESAGWAVFELQSAAPLTASSTLRLKPGMAVRAAGGGATKRVKISCKQGVETAFDIALTNAATNKPASSGVLLQGLHISGCSGSAVRVAGALRPSQGLQWASLPAGLHLADSALTGNSAAVGGAVRAVRAAVYLDSVELSDNQAAQLGGAVSVDQGLLVALKSSFKANTAGSGQISTLDAGVGAAVFANSSTVLLANTTVVDNTGSGVGGCAVKATKPQGLVVAGCTFDSNTCKGDGGTVVGGNYAASTCFAGGASLMVVGSLPPFSAGNATQCSLAPKHLVHISDTSFGNDVPTQHSCGGSVLLDSVWLEMHRSSITDNAPASRGGALASTGSAVVMQDVSISNHSSHAYGGAVFQLRGRFWATRTRMAHAFTRNEGGGCLYITDATEVRLSGCDFQHCRAKAEAGAVYYQMMYDRPEIPPPVSIHATRVAHCTAKRDGGALGLVRVNVTITDSVFDSNEGYYGGVLNTGNGALSVSRTNFTNNMASAGGQGGVIYSYDHAGADFTDCIWHNNTAYQGAGLYAATYGGEAVWSFTNCAFTANTANQRGGAIWTSGTNLSFAETRFTGNKALMAAGIWATNTGTELPLTMDFEGCALQGNSAEQSAGIAWVTGYSSVNLSSCSISRNRAGQSAAGLYLQDTPARLSGCVMAGNTARTAAVLSLQGANSTVTAVNSRFENNKASDQAGAALLATESSLALSRTTFSNNSAGTAGGAVVVLEGAKVSCSVRCNFSSNSAALGGAIAVESAVLSLSDTVLTDNSASAELVSLGFAGDQQRAGSGGAVFAANATVRLSKCVVQDNRAEVQGGAVQLMSSKADMAGTRFTGNTAARQDDAAATAASQRDPTSGGAILAGLLPAAGANSSRIASQLRLQDCVLSGNTAGFGGAIAAVDTAAGAQAATRSSNAVGAAAAAAALSVQLAGTSLSNNTALVSGGAVFTNLPSATLNLTNSKVTSNTAGQGGGGIAAVTPAAVQLASSSISRNSAAFCAGMLLDSPARNSAVRGGAFEGNVAGQGAAGDTVLGQLPQWNSTGSGGGLCVIPAATVSLSKASIIGNSALHGAGMFVQDCVSRTGSPMLADNSTCRVEVGSGTVISSNKQQAGGSGSAMYTTDTAAVRVAPDARAGKVATRSSSSSVITEAGSADSLAAKPSAVLGGFKQQAGLSMVPGTAGSRSPVLLVDSGNKLPPVQLRLVDQLGQQLPASLLQQLTFKAQAAATVNDSRSDTNLLGVTSVVPSGGNGSAAAISFDWLELQGAPGETLDVSFAVLEAPDVTPAVVQVQLKECTAGQAVLRGRRPDLYAGCTNCTNPLFSFDPTAPQCSTCPPAGTYSVCSRGVVTPAPGFWQSHPRSSQLLACPNPAACSRPGRTEGELAAASAAMAAGGRRRGLLAAAEPEQEAVAAYQQLQCAPGYTGNLCSNCERSDRVTQSLAHTCKSCSVSRAGSIVLFVLVRLFDLSIVLLSVFLVFKERQRRNMAVNAGLVTPDKIRDASKQGMSVTALAAHSGPVETKLNDQPTSDAAGSTGVDTYLQMFIEFMQLLSIFRLTRIGVVWRSAAEAVLLAMSITPISSYSWVSLECALRAGLSPQQYALDSTLASTYIPVALVAVVCSIVLLRNMRRARQLRYSLRSFPALVPELLLAAVKAIAYGYPVVVGSVLGLFSCKQLDSSSQVPGEVTAAQGNFWNRDLDTMCFQGIHLTYALAVGVPMLLLIALYPLLQLLLLSRQARTKPDGLADVSFWANYSMLYQDYKHRMYLWGSVRDLRQLLLVVVVVVLQPHPVQLQMVGGWVLSMVLLLSHISLLPFRTSLLNGLQTAMLAAISFTFYTGVLSGLAEFPAIGASVLQYAALVFNLLVALVLLGVLVWRARLWLDWDKDGKVTWTDVKSTLQAGSELTGRTASSIVKRVGSISSTASWKSHGRSSSRMAPQSNSGQLPAADSQSLDGFGMSGEHSSLGSRLASLKLSQGWLHGSGSYGSGALSPSTSAAVSGSHELPASSSGVQASTVPGDSAADSTTTKGAVNTSGGSS